MEIYDSEDIKVYMLTKEYYFRNADSFTKRGK